MPGCYQQNSHCCLWGQPEVIWQVWLLWFRFNYRKVRSQKSKVSGNPGWRTPATAGRWQSRGQLLYSTVITHCPSLGWSPGPLSPEEHPPAWDGAQLPYPQRSIHQAHRVFLQQTAWSECRVCLLQTFLSQNLYPVRGWAHFYLSNGLQ